MTGRPGDPDQAHLEEHDPPDQPDVDLEPDSQADPGNDGDGRDR